MNEKKPGVGVVVGRFHVPALTAGHDEVMKYADAHQRLCVLVGVSPWPSARNPLPFECRRDLILERYPDAVVFPICDRKSDRDWSDEVDYMLAAVFPGEPVTLYGGRDSFISTYSGRHNPVRIQEWHPPHPSGTQVRDAANVIDSEAFRAGVIYGRTRPRWGRVLTTVDVAPVVNGHVLLARKRADGGKWRFVGGIVDPKDISFAAAAARELREEAGLSASRYELLAEGVQISDWRIAGTESAVMTAFYAAHVGAAHGPDEHPGDDVDEIRWFLVRDVTQSLVDEHLKLGVILVDHFEVKR